MTNAATAAPPASAAARGHSARAAGRHRRRATTAYAATRASIARHPKQTAPAARLAAIITATAATPAIAVNRTAVKILGAGLPCAERRRPVSAIANATELHTSPHPAIGSPVAFCTPEANAPFQTAEQSSLPSVAQKELPPDRRRTSSIHSTTDQSDESAPSATSVAQPGAASPTGASGGNRFPRCSFFFFSKRLILSPVSWSPICPEGRRFVCYPSRSSWGCSSVGRAPEWHSGGRRFDPVQLHQAPSLRSSARSGPSAHRRLAPPMHARLGDEQTSNLVPGGI